MSISNELSNYPLTQAPMMSLSWIPHTSSSTSSAFRVLTPQISSCTSQKLISASSITVPELSAIGTNQASKRKSRKVPNYKHVPHKDKPPHLVARRNARERKRVQAVNSAFAKLRKSVPIENRSKRLSKVKTLHRAIEYIKNLQALLGQSEDTSILQSNQMQYSRHLSESQTSQDEDDDFEDNEREISKFQEFEDIYLESDVDVVNKENKSQRWSSISTGCEPNYWTYIPYHEECSGNTENE